MLALYSRQKYKVLFNTNKLVLLLRHCNLQNSYYGSLSYDVKCNFFNYAQSHLVNLITF